MKVKCMFNKKQYNSKPQGMEIGALQKGLVQTEIEIKNLSESLSKGATFKPALLNGTKSSDWVQQQIFALDFDDGATLDGELEFAKEINILPVFIYTSFSHTEQHHKFRMVFCTDKVINDVKERDKLQLTLINLFSNSDKVTKDCTRLFFGGKALFYNNYDNRINSNDIISKYFKKEYLSNNSKEHLVHKTVKEKSTIINTNNINKSNINKNIESIEKLDVKELKELLQINNNKNVFKTDKELYDYINKIDLNEYLNLYNKFNCILPNHEDKNPSANIFISKNGTPLYNCFGCNCVRTIIGITEELSGCSRHKAIEFIKSVYNLEVARSKWVDEQKQIMLESIQYLNTDEFKEHFPNLNKVIRYRKIDIQSMLLYFTQYIKDDLKVDNKPIFFASYKNLMNTLNTKKRDKVSQSINLFCLLSMLERVDCNKIPKKELSKAIAIKKKYNFKKLTNFYTFNEYGVIQLKEAESKAKILIDNHLYIKACSREYILRTFGEEEANRVFPQYKYENKQGTSEKSNRNTNVIAKYILDTIQKQNYVFEKDLRKNEEVDLQWKKSIQEILDGYNLKRIRVSKEVKNKYKVKTKTYGSYIIVKND